MPSRKKRTTGSCRKKAAKRNKRKPKATLSQLLERLEVFFKVTQPSITTLIAEANGRADRAEKKLKALEARVEQLTDCLTEDHLEAADIMGVDPFTYLRELLQIHKQQLFGSETGILAPYGKAINVLSNSHGV